MSQLEQLYNPGVQVGGAVYNIAKLSTTGASTGNVIKFDGTSVVWGSESVTPGELTLTNAHILVGNASNVAADVAVTGDVTISNLGVTAIGASKVTKTMLATGIKANFMDMFLDDSYTTVGGAAAEVISVPGVVGTDKVIVSLYDNGTSNVSIVSAVAGTDAITVTFSADPGNDTIIAYVVKRATA